MRVRHTRWCGLWCRRPRVRVTSLAPQKGLQDGPFHAAALEGGTGSSPARAALSFARGRARRHRKRVGAHLRPVRGLLALCRAVRSAGTVEGHEPPTPAASAVFARSRMTSSPARVAAVLRREAGLFVLAVLVIAVHVIDDSFAQPQPGTSASDHLVSGLVPLALLGLAAWAYPRLRGG